MMKVNSAELSLVGNHQENQDRISIVVDTGSLLSIVSDGMEFHTEAVSYTHLTLPTILLV